MNIIQFWIVDTIVKVSPNNGQKPMDHRERQAIDHDPNQFPSNENESSPLLPK
jgi:hypothetical protein